MNVKLAHYMRCRTSIKGRKVRCHTEILRKSEMFETSISTDIYCSLVRIQCIQRITSNSNIFSKCRLFFCLFVFLIQFAYASHFQLNVFLRFIFLIIIFSDSFPTSFSFSSDWFYWADAPNRSCGNVFSVPHFVFHVKSRFFHQFRPVFITFDWNFI